MVPIFLILILALQEAEKPAQPAPMSDDAFRFVSRFLDYDRSDNLDANIVHTETFQVYQLEKIAFNGLNNERIPAILALPRIRRAPYPLVLLVHELGGDKDQWWDDESYVRGGKLTRRLLASGHAVMMLDMPGHGERTVMNDFAPPDRVTFQMEKFGRLRAMLVQAAVEQRRAVDFLQTRPEIDKSRIALAGYGYGALVGLMSAAVDDRFCENTLIAPPIVADPGAVFAARHYLHRIDHPILILSGENDPSAPLEAVKALYSSAPGNKKQLQTFASNHRLPEAYIEDVLLRYKDLLRKGETATGTRGGG